MVNKIDDLTTRRNSRWGRAIALGSLALLLPAALFYLFAVPALVASGAMPATLATVSFAAFMFLQFWMLTAEFAFTSVAALYGFRRKTLFNFLRFSSALFDVIFPDGKPKTQAGAAVPCLLSYCLTVYGFAVAYTFVSATDKSAFSSGSLSLFDATYFSLITAATIGYGDIAPVSKLSRCLVMAEVAITFAYAVFLLSILAGSTRERFLNRFGDETQNHAGSGPRADRDAAQEK